MLTDKAFSRSPKSVDNADLFAQAAEKSGKGGLVGLRQNQQEFIAAVADETVLGAQIVSDDAVLKFQFGLNTPSAIRREGNAAMTAAAVPAEKAGVRRRRAGFIGEDGQFLGRDETNRGKERSVGVR